MTLEQILNEFGTKLKEDTQKAIDATVKAKAEKNGSDFGGNTRLAASVRFFFSTRNNTPVLNLAMSDYWEVLNDGRGKNKKRPPTKAILDWMRRRGIKTELSDSKKNIIKLTTNKLEKKDIKKKTIEIARLQHAYNISLSIGKKGIEPTHFFDKVLNDGRLVELQNKIKTETKKNIVVKFKKDLG